MKTLRIIGFVILVSFSGCNPDVKNIEVKQAKAAASLKGEFAITGADALYPLMDVLSREFMKQNPELKIQVTKGGTGRGLQQLLKGKTDLAMVSRELTPDEESFDLWFFPVTKESVFPIVSSKNPFIEMIREQGIKRIILKQLYLGNSEVTWGDVLSVKSGEKVMVHTRADSSGAAVIWSHYLGIRNSELTGIKVEGDEGMVQAIKNEPLSLGYCNAHYAYDYINHSLYEGLELIPIDINNNGKIDTNEEFFETICQSDKIAFMGKYTVHLCREIALVSHGKPTDANIIEFIRWIYTDGQSVAREKGYAELKNCIVEDYLDLLDKTIFK